MPNLKGNALAEKCARVIRSCETLNQLEVCRKYLLLAQSAGVLSGEEWLYIFWHLTVKKALLDKSIAEGVPYNQYLEGYRGCWH